MKYSAAKTKREFNSIPRNEYGAPIEETVEETTVHTKELGVVNTGRLRHCHVDDTDKSRNHAWDLRTGKRVHPISDSDGGIPMLWSSPCPRHE
jgi:DNA mismatch repair protein MutH